MTRSKFPIPRSPRNAPAIVKKTSSNWQIATRWLGRLAYVVGGALIGTAVTFISQGPDSIRKLPEIPKAITETYARYQSQRHLDRFLTASWESEPPKTAIFSPRIRLQLSSDGGQVQGIFISPLVRKWSVFSYALVVGKVDNEVLTLEVFDFIAGKKQSFATLSMKIRALTEDVVTEEPFGVYFEEWDVMTLVQTKDVLPDTFKVVRLPQL